MVCFVWCCERSSPYPPIPEIHLQELQILDKTDSLGTSKHVRVFFSFVDGDGDLGVRIKNIDESFIKVFWYQKMADGTYEQCLTDEKEIPYSEVMNKDEAFNKTLKGTFDSFWVTPWSVPNVDTVRLEFFITDRALHQSNIEITPDFSIFADTTFVF